jgi:hypoxanthine phosphoribosyltransferase
MQILLTSTQIQSRVTELGAEISAIYQGKPLTIVGVMTGGLIFVADLVRSINIPHKIALIRASSYRGETEKPGELKLFIDPIPDIKGRDVLIVDDILDTGHTMHKLLLTLRQYEPASLKTLALLWKPSRTIIDIKPDYHGFQIENHFVIGYGLDYNDDYRHLPYVAIYEPPQSE